MKKLFFLAGILSCAALKSQNVGIGTNSPQKKLHVVQGLSGGSFFTNATAVLESNTTNILQFSNSATSIAGIYSGSNLTNQRSAIKFEADSSVIFTSGGTVNRIVIDNNGYLGINAFSPVSRLHVSNGSSGNTTVASSRIATFEDNSNTYLQLLTPNANETGILAGNVSTLIKSALVFPADSSIHFRTGGNNGRMFITDNGFVGINNASPTAMFHVKDGGAVFTGPTSLPSSPGNPPATGAGSRMMWWPQKAAFRAGTVTGTYWDASLIGKWSFAGGYDCIAGGDYSASFGYSNQVNGDYAAAFGNDNSAGGSAAFTIGHSSFASGANSFAGGEDCATTGSRSFAFGNESVASGPDALAIGVRVYASGSRSAAFGYQDTAIGTNSVVFGALNSVRATNGFAAGIGLVVNPFGTIALGQYNNVYANGSPDIPSIYMPIVVVGTGDDDTHRENGVEIYRDGQIIMNYLKVRTTVTSNLTPHTDDTYKLGSSSKRWMEVWSANPFLQSSDARLKTNIASLEYGLQTVMRMNPVSYNMKTNLQNIELGFLAQDMEKLVPEAVVTPEDGGMKAMKYTNLIPVLVKAIQEQQQLIEKLEQRLGQLEKDKR